jgi:hypothetical protein
MALFQVIAQAEAQDQAGAMCRRRCEPDLDPALSSRGMRCEHHYDVVCDSFSGRFDALGDLKRAGVLRPRRPQGAAASRIATSTTRGRRWALPLGRQRHVCQTPDPRGQARQHGKAGPYPGFSQS